ncbi:hypothetical protein F5Y10DRAFT_273235 [Nemania abortiva]|nr:hypothetical protein F5Y10DRAFT_273235 [Nemania abortiva]
MAGQGFAPVADRNVTNGQGYILNTDRSHAAAGRLNLQFVLWKEVMSFNIHPSIGSSIGGNAAIAEVASGSSIRLIDVSAKMGQLTKTDREFVNNCDWRTVRRPDGSTYPKKVHDCGQPTCKWSKTGRQQQNQCNEAQNGGSAK